MLQFWAFDFIITIIFFISLNNYRRLTKIYSERLTKGKEQSDYMKFLLTLILIIYPSSFCSAQDGPIFQISIFYGGGNYIISENQKKSVEDFINNIPNVNQYNITIHSHTDNIGGVEFNDWLSKMRSQSALEELLINNIKLEMIEIKDFGLHNPVYDNSTWEGKLKNRRVDILVWPLAL